MNKPVTITASHLQTLAVKIKSWGHRLGFEDIGITHVGLGADEKHLQAWLKNQYHGSMHYMEHHGTRRSRPAELWPGTLRVISVRMDYSDHDGYRAKDILSKPERAFISRYALGRDYHKVLRKRLRQLAQYIERYCEERQLIVTTPDEPSFIQRAFVDSAPVLEKALARNAGLGWIGKHTNLINKNAGSWFFLGELFTNLPLPVDKPAGNHCGSCIACIDVCPTHAIVAPYQVDARRCVSYLTIENKGPIPPQFRKAIGNRVFGCDDCQLFCPWNKFAQHPKNSDFAPRNNLDNVQLIELFNWSKPEFSDKTQGSAIRRIGYVRWLRNLAVALGNAPFSSAVVRALENKLKTDSALVREHVSWALAQHRKKGHNKHID